MTIRTPSSRWLCLPVLLILASAAAGQTLLDEDFEGDFPPPGWTTVDDSQSDLDCPWLRSDEYLLDGLEAPGLGAAADSDVCADAETPEGAVDTSLLTPELDLTGISDTVLSFDLGYRHHFSGQLDLDITTDGGAQWTTLETYNTGPPWAPFYAELKIVDLSAWDGEPAVTLRWRYTAGNGWWAFVDNVLVGPAGPGVLTVDPAGLHFGNLHTGTSQFLEVEVSNTGNPGDDALELSQISIGGAPEFELSGGSCQAGSTHLGARQSCTVQVMFEPGSVGGYSGNVTIWTADGRSAIVPLTGAGIPTAVVDVDPEEVSTTLDIGQAATQTLTIANLGTATLDWAIPLVHGQSLNGAGRNSGGELLRQGLILVHNSGSNTLVALDPETGDVVNPAFVDTTDLGFGSKPMALMHPDGERLLLTHQTDNVIHSFDTEGNYLGVFAPAGGADPAVMQNVRGMAFHPETGNLLVTSAFGNNPNTVAEFNLDGQFLGQFIESGAGGMNGPWSMVFRDDDLLLAAGNNVHAFDHQGNYLEQFNNVQMNFVQQIIELEDGRILVANSVDGAWEFTADGNLSTHHNQYNNASGLHELPGGTLLISNNTGIHEIDRNGNIIRDVITGASSMFSLIQAVDCTVPDWISVGQTAGSVASNGSTEISITVDTTHLAPGVHENMICIESNDPVRPRVQVPITVEVEQPDNYGLIEGFIVGTGHCALNPMALEGASIQAEGGAGIFTRFSDENGFYQIYLPDTASPVTLTASASGHLDDISASVSIAAGQTTTENFELALDAPCMTLAEDSYHFDVQADSHASQSMTIGNIEGAGSLSWSINEGESVAAQIDPRAHFPASVRQVEHKDDENASIHAAPRAADMTPGLLSGAAIASVPGHFSVPAYSTTSSAEAPGYVALDALRPSSLLTINPDQPTSFYAGTFIRNDFENKYMLASSGGQSPFHTFGRVDSATGELEPLGLVTGAPAVITWTSMRWDHSNQTLYAVGNGDELYTIDLETLAATLVGTIAGPGVNPSGGIVTIAISPEGLMYALDIFDDVLLAVDKTTAEAAVIGPLGVDANFAQDMDFDQTDGTLYWAGYLFTNASRMYTIDTDTGAATLIDDIQGRIELLSFSIARPGGGCSTPEEIDWLSVSETAGTTAPHSSNQISVSVDTTGLNAGRYEAFLCVSSNDQAMSMTWIPVSVEVSDPAAGILEGTVNGLGRCDQNPDPLRHATVTVTGNSRSFELLTDSDGYYHIPINEGEGPVDIAVQAVGHSDTTVTGVAINAGATTVEDIDLILEAPCFTAAPETIDAATVPGGTTSATLAIGNVNGGGSLDWNIDMASPTQLPDGNALFDEHMQMSQTFDNTIVQGNSIGCIFGPNHALRRFYFDEHPGVGNQIHSIDIGVGTASNGAMTVNLYQLPRETPVDTIPMEQLELVGVLAVPLSEMHDGSILNVPVTGMIDDIEQYDLVVEAVASGAFFVGATNTGETHPGFVMAPQCGIMEPTRIDTIENFETVHIIQNVNVSSGGSCAVGEEVDWLTTATDSGTTAAGAITDLELIFDATGLDIGSHTATLCVNSNDSGQRRIEVPVQLSVNAAVPGELAADPAELDFGEAYIGTVHSQAFSVRNVADTDAQAVVIDAIDIAGGIQFSISGGDCAPGTSLAPGQSCLVEVSFAPDTSGSFADLIEIKAGGQSALVSLSGSAETGVPDSIYQDRFEAASTQLIGRSER